MIGPYYSYLLDAERAMQLDNNNKISLADFITRMHTFCSAHNSHTNRTTQQGVTPRQSPYTDFPFLLHFYLHRRGNLACLTISKGSMTDGDQSVPQEHLCRPEQVQSLTLYYAGSTLHTFHPRYIDGDGAAQ